MSAQLAEHTTVFLKDEFIIKAVTRNKIVSLYIAEQRQ